MSFVLLLQAPYIIYVEVVEVEDVQTSPVAHKININSLRHTRSEENIAEKGAAAPATTDANGATNGQLLNRIFL